MTKVEKAKKTPNELRKSVLVPPGWHRLLVQLAKIEQMPKTWVLQGALADKARSLRLKHPPLPWQSNGKKGVRRA